MRPAVNPGAAGLAAGPRALDDRRPELAQPLDGEGHEVARLEPAAERVVLDLEQAAGADGPAAEEVARAGRGRPPKRARASRPNESARPTTSRARPRPSGRRRPRPSPSSSRSGAVAPAGHGRRARPASRSTARSSVAKSLPFAGPSRTVDLVALEVARRPVVQDEEAADRLGGALRRAGRRPACRRSPRPRARSRARSSRAAPRPGRPGRGSPRCSRSRRSAAGTRPPGSRSRGAPTSSRRAARRRRSRGTTAGAGSAARRRDPPLRGRRRRHRRARRRRPRSRRGARRAPRSGGRARGASSSVVIGWRKRTELWARRGSAATSRRRATSRSSHGPSVRARPRERHGAPAGAVPLANVGDAHPTSLRRGGLSAAVRTAGTSSATGSPRTRPRRSGAGAPAASMRGPPQAHRPKPGPGRADPP